jgi:pilus assembly protein Flp/PilA
MLSRFVSLQNFLSTSLRSDRGATAVEYGIIVALIAAVIVVVVGLLGQHVSSAFNTVNTDM